MSTIVAMLKTREIDLANITAEQRPGLTAAGVSTEASPVGGSVINIAWGGICLPEDFRYKADIHNKDPWVDMRVRRALTISIDRQAICDAIFAGGAVPAGVPLISVGMQKYQYPYDPAAAKQLLIDAGYPNGFTFPILSFTLKGVAECPRVIEAMVGYWQQIGLDPKITVSEQPAYVARRQYLKNPGELAPQPIAQGADMLEKATMFLMPSGAAMIYQDEGSYAIWKEGIVKINSDERNAYVEKLNKYYFENYGPIPVIKVGYCYAWNPDKVSPFPHTATPTPYYLEYVRHAQPLNTFRLFTPWEGR
jgi:ABC-type transport system substrate-binding protein